MGPEKTGRRVRGTNEDTHNERMDGETNGVGRDGKIDYFSFKKNLVSTFNSTWKLLLDFLLETERNEILILVFDV